MSPTVSQSVSTSRATFYKHTLLHSSMGHRTFLEWWKAWGSTWVKMSPEMLPTLQRTYSNNTICLMTLVLLGNERSYFMFWKKKKKTFASHRIIESDVTLRGLKLNRSDLSGTRGAAVVIPEGCNSSELSYFRSHHSAAVQIQKHASVYNALSSWATRFPVLMNY